MMANSRLCLFCKHCGEEIILATGCAGEYHTRWSLTRDELEAFFEKHKAANCLPSSDPRFPNCSDDARVHFFAGDDTTLEEALMPLEEGKYDDE